VSPGPAPKQPSRRIRTTTKNIGVVKSAGVAPSMPRGLCRQAQEAWRGYWSDTVSGVMRGSDATIVLRWVANVDRYHRLLAEADAEPVTIGSAGQAKGNPLYDTAYRIEASIREDEKQLGIGPLSRLKLGVALSESAKSLAEINTEAANATETDPRAALSVVAGRDS
jgi:P27 family predicted phage terminase small subunit